MTFIDKLKTQVNGLIHIKSQLYWYRTGKWDGAHESVHLLLDVLDPDEDVAGDIYPEAHTRIGIVHDGVDVLLFIDGTPKWVLIYSGAVELIE